MCAFFPYSLTAHCQLILIATIAYLFKFSSLLLYKSVSMGTTEVPVLFICAMDSYNKIKQGTI